MDIKKFFYRTRLWLLMYGFSWVIRIAGFVNKDFRALLARDDYSFIMSSQDGEIARQFKFIHGKLYAKSGGISTDFALIWRDNQSGGKVMMDILLGKRKALYKAVIHGVLKLEGEGKYVSMFMETMNQLNRMFGPKKKTKGSA
jgi:hypothetical protein